MIHSILVKDYMDNNPHSVLESTPLTEVVKVFCGECVVGAPVVNTDKKVVGYISEQDCLTELLNDSYHLGEPPTVASSMSKDVISFTSNSSIVEVAQAIIEKKARNFPVVDNGKLVGLITRSRILNALVENRKDGYQG